MPKNDGTPGEHLLNLPHQLYCVVFLYCISGMCWDRMCWVVSNLGITGIRAV